MKRAFCVVLGIVLSLSCVACGEREWKEIDPIQVPPGGFLYRGYDEVGTEVVTGWLLFSSDNGDTVAGDWDLREVGNPGHIGPQIGRGRFEGWWGGQDKLSLNLNPGEFDNNVFLDGRLQGDVFSGNWEHSGFEGTEREGTFDARRRP